MIKSRNTKSLEAKILQQERDIERLTEKLAAANAKLDTIQRVIKSADLRRWAKGAQNATSAKEKYGNMYNEALYRGRSSR